MVQLPTKLEGVYDEDARRVKDGETEIRDVWRHCQRLQTAAPLW